MQKVIIIGIGGFIGAITRYGICGIAQTQIRSGSLPYGTLFVNLIGCFIFGIISYFAESGRILNPTTRAFMLTGFLGALTTFSTFSNETVNLFRDGAIHLSVINIALNLIPGITFLILGQKIAFLVSNL